MAVVSGNCYANRHTPYCQVSACTCFCHMSPLATKNPEKHGCNVIVAGEHCTNIVNYKYKVSASYINIEVYRCLLHRAIGASIDDESICDERPVLRRTFPKQPVVKLTRPKTADYTIPSKVDELIEVEECLIYYADRYQHLDGRAYTFHDCPAHWVIVKWVEE